jgi:hypothetical protein
MRPRKPPYILAPEDEEYPIRHTTSSNEFNNVRARAFLSSLRHLTRDVNIPSYRAPTDAWHAARYRAPRLYLEWARWATQAAPIILGAIPNKDYRQQYPWLPGAPTDHEFVFPQFLTEGGRVYLAPALSATYIAMRHGGPLSQVQQVNQLLYNLKHKDYDLLRRSIKGLYVRKHMPRSKRFETVMERSDSSHRFKPFHIKQIFNTRWMREKLLPAWKSVNIVDYLCEGDEAIMRMEEYKNPRAPNAGCDVWTVPQDLAFIVLCEEIPEYAAHWFALMFLAQSDIAPPSA